MSEPIKTPAGTPPANPSITPPAEPATPPADNPNPEPQDQQPEPPPEPVPGRKDPLLAALFEDVDPEFKKVDDTPDDPETPATDPATPTTPPATPPTDPAATTPAQPAAPVKKKKKKVAIIESLDESYPDGAPRDGAVVTPGHTSPPIPPEPAPAATPPADPDAAYIAGLSDEQKEELREAEYAEKLYPDKYKGRKAALLAWYKNLDSEMVRLTKENPGRTLNEEDEEFAKVLQSKPKLDNAHSKRVMREIAKDEVQAEVRQAMEPQLTELKTKQKEIEFQPQLHRMMAAVNGAMDELLVQDEQSPFSAAIKARNAEPPAGVDVKQYREELTAQYALENKIMEDEKKKSGALTREFVSIVKGVKQYNPSNETHQHLLAFIHREGQAMRGQQVDGKIFLPRDEYNAVISKDPSQKAKYVTFSNTDILSMIGHQAKIDMENRLKAEMEDAKAKGFERRKPAASAQAPKPAAQSAAEPQPINPPKVTSSRVPAVPAAAPSSDSINVIETLGLRKK